MYVVGLLAAGLGLLSQQAAIQLSGRLGAGYGEEREARAKEEGAPSSHCAPAPRLEESGRLLHLL